MAYEHESGISGAYQRELEGTLRQGVVYLGDRFLQGADLQDAAAIERYRSLRVSRMVARDGDRREGAEALVSRDNASVLCAAHGATGQGRRVPAPHRDASRCYLLLPTRTAAHPVAPIHARPDNADNEASWRYLLLPTRPAAHPEAAFISRSQRCR